MNKEIYQQMQEAKIEDYKSLTLEKLTQFVEDISRSIETKPKVIYSELPKEDIKEYNKLIRKDKPGYLYQIGQELVICTGYKGAKDILKKCKRDNVPFLFRPNIWIIDDERGINARIEDITWVKIKDQVEGKCKSNT
jgi:hypothetical protein